MGAQLSNVKGRKQWRLQVPAASATVLLETHGTLKDGKAPALFFLLKFGRLRPNARPPAFHWVCTLVVNNGPQHRQTHNVLCAGELERCGVVVICDAV